MAPSAAAPQAPGGLAPLRPLRRAWFLFEMWTGLASAEGVEFYALAPLAVLLFVGLPCYSLYRVAVTVLGFFAV